MKIQVQISWAGQSTKNGDKNPIFWQAPSYSSALVRGWIGAIKMKKDVQKTSGQIYVERPVKHWLGPGDQAMFDPESCCWVVVGRVRQELLKQQQLYGGRTRYIQHSSAQCNYWIHALDLTFWFGEHILKICISFYNNVELRSKKCNSCRSGSLQEQNDQ